MNRVPLLDARLSCRPGLENISWRLEMTLEHRQLLISECLSHSSDYSSPQRLKWTRQWGVFRANQ